MPIEDNNETLIDFCGSGVPSYFPTPLQVQPCQKDAIFSKGGGGLGDFGGEKRFKSP